MTPQIRERFRVWVWRFSLVTMTIVVVLSWINKIEVFDLIVRAGVSFGIMFFLMTGILSLFEKTAPLSSENELPGPDDRRGGLVDFSVGDDELQESQVSASKIPGQVDPGLSEGLPDSERQAEIVRRMGWE